MSNLSHQQFTELEVVVSRTNTIDSGHKERRSSLRIKEKLNSLFFVILLKLQRFIVIKTN